MVSLQTLLGLWRAYCQGVIISNELLDAISSFPLQDFLPILFAPSDSKLSWPMPVEDFLLPFLHILKKIVSVILSA